MKTSPGWEAKRTDETRLVERALREAGFERADAYRYNRASIRVRVVDSRFASLSDEARDAKVEPVLDTLPKETQADIITLFTFSPEEIQQGSTALREAHLNDEFEHPSPSRL